MALPRSLPELVEPAHKVVCIIGIDREPFGNVIKFPVCLEGKSLGIDGSIVVTAEIGNEGSRVVVTGTQKAVGIIHSAGRFQFE